MNPLKIFLLFVTLFGLFFIFQTDSVFSQMKNGDEITLIGEVVDANCYLHGGMKGNDHKQCAIACAKAGAPLAILTDEGVLYFPIVSEGKNPNKDFMEHIAAKVEVKGQYYSYSGTKGIFVSSVKKAE
ncbi:MAG: hypothetical protein ACRDFC_07315 [Ignavibacteria bacterium]